MEKNFLSLHTLIIATGLALHTIYQLSAVAQGNVEKITFKSDIPFSKEEFFYLTDLKEKTANTQDDLVHAHNQLKQKKRFHIIDITTHGTNANFNLTANWIFKDVQIKGIWFGKHRYKNLYLQHPGDVFDISLHEESVTIIKKYLHNHGYFDCLVLDEITYDKKEKTISITITIKTRKQSRIDDAKFIFDGFACDIKIKNKLQKLFREHFANRYFSKKLTNKIKQQIESVLAKNGYTRSRVTLKGCIKSKTKHTTIIIKIRLDSQILLTFKGNSYFSAAELEKNFIDLTKPKWLLDPNIMAEQILHGYHKSGFWSSKIRYKKITPRSYEFCIKEGKRIIIENIIVKDKSSGKTEKNKFFFQPVISAKYYDENILEDCLEKLKTFYIEHGFWDFTLLSKEFIKKKHDRYTIALTINKGAQRFLGKKNVPLNPAWLADQRLKLLERFQKQGYWYVDAQAEFIITASTNHSGHRIEKIRVIWHIKTGKQVKFDKLIVRGSTRLPFKRIIQEIQFEEGDLWDRKKLNYSRKKLKELDIFKYIAIHPKKLSHKQSQKPIILTVLDDDPIKIKFRTGYFLTSKNFLLKRESTYKFGATLLVKNPLNIADKLSLNTDLTRFEKNFDLDYHIPHLFSKSTNAKFKVYAHEYVHPLQVGESDSAYEATQNGFLSSITKEYKPHSFWGINIGNEWMKTDRTRGNMKLSPNMIDKTIPYFFLEPNLVIDNLDDRLNTKKGSFTFCSVKVMVPYANRSTTYKFMIDRSMFCPIYHDVILAIKGGWGHIFRQKFEEIMPIERFYLGGAYSVRGYSKDAVPPLGETIKICPDGTIKKEYTIQGGSSMINGSIELRFPLYNSFSGVVFQDIGVLSQSGFSGFKGRWYPTSGFGLRYHTPIGALRFDIGWKWKKDSGPSYSWYLTIGQSF